MDKNFMWIFDYYANTLQVKDIVEISDYDITLDEETNAKSTINVLKKTTAKAKDIVAVKHNNDVVYWGIIDEIQNEDGTNLYKYVTEYITNIFDRKIRLTGDSVIRTDGIEDFIEDTIELFFTNNSDTLTNIGWLKLSVLSHTPKEISVTNVENRIYNLHTWMTNCNQYYNLTYTFEVVKVNSNYYLQMKMKVQEYDKVLIDTNAMNISNYTEVFETNITTKVLVLYDKKNGADQQGQYVLFLKTDRTTTTSQNDPNRALGNITTVYTENYEDANQTALDVMKGNEYNHNITFNFDKYIPIGTPIAIKTKESLIYNTYISQVKVTQKNFYKYICGNIRINFIEKLKKEKQNA